MRGLLRCGAWAVALWTDAWAVALWTDAWTLRLWTDAWAVVLWICCRYRRALATGLQEVLHRYSTAVLRLEREIVRVPGASRHLATGLMYGLMD
jgi:hypothetical protein